MLEVSGCVNMSQVYSASTLGKKAEGWVDPPFTYRLYLRIGGYVLEFVEYVCFLHHARDKADLTKSPA